MPATSATANPVLASRAFAALFRLDCILIPPSRLEDDVEGMVIHVRVSRTAKIRWVQPDAAVTLIRPRRRARGLATCSRAGCDQFTTSVQPSCRQNAVNEVKKRRWKDGTGRVGRKRARSSRLAVEPTDDQHVAGPRGSNSRQPFSRSARRVETPEDKSLRNGLRPPSTATA
jgi:hypothetical protein